jgi:hypothetical protein
MGQNTMGQNTTPSPPQSYYPGHASPQTPPSSNQSPTSYHAHLHVRQLRPQKQPLYTPACLRPTESSRPQNIPGPRMPDTPPSSKQSSLESGNIGLGSPEASKKSAQDADLDMLRLGLSRAASESIDEEYCEVTGPPTVAHWKVRRKIQSSPIVFVLCLSASPSVTFPTLGCPEERPWSMNESTRGTVCFNMRCNESTRPVTQSFFIMVSHGRKAGRRNRSARLSSTYTHSLAYTHICRNTLTNTLFL